jgi:polyferredoxin
MTYQQSRTLTRTALFLLFLFAPLLGIFRFDLELRHFIIFGQEWSPGLESVLYDGAGSTEAAGIMSIKAFIPLVAFIGIAFLLIWRFGRIYCGWLCPHFSVVEMINQLMLKQLNRITLWESPSKPNRNIVPRLIVAVVAVGMAFTWSVSLLSYLLAPVPLLKDLVNFNLGLGSTFFICAATVTFSFDFIFVRYLFCKYVCALGFFQSLIWMANQEAMAGKFDRKRAKACRDCDKECDKACPMRLPTRNMKRAKFACTQCAQCISACEQVQKDNPEGTLLKWVSGPEAVEIDRPAAPPTKFRLEEITR